MPFIRPKKYVNEKSPNALKNHEPIIFIDHKLMVYVYRCLTSLPTRRKHLHVQSNCQRKLFKVHTDTDLNLTHNL